MASKKSDLVAVRVSQKGQVTIPKPLREKFDIEAGGEMSVYEDGERIVVEPIPELSELHGIHAGEGKPKDILATVRAETAREREGARADEARPRET